MITITSPIEQDFIKGILDGKTIDGITFHFLKKEGRMKLLFEAVGQGDPVLTAKKAIKNTKTGSVLYFQVA